MLKSNKHGFFPSKSDGDCELCLKMSQIELWYIEAEYQIKSNQIIEIKSLIFESRLDGLQRLLARILLEQKRVTEGQGDTATGPIVQYTFISIWDIKC